MAGFRPVVICLCLQAAAGVPPQSQRQMASRYSRDDRYDDGINEYEREQSDYYDEYDNTVSRKARAAPRRPPPRRPPQPKPKPRDEFSARGGARELPPRPRPRSAAFAPASSSSAQVQGMVTGRMRQALMALGYRSAEIDMINPEIAKVVITRGLERPRQGMPPAWTKDR